MRRSLVILCGALAALFTSDLAHAGKVSSLLVTPNPVGQNQTTTIALGQAGSKCGYLLSTGVGAPIGPKVLKPGGANFPVSYPQAGTYTVTVTGKKKGKHAKCNLGAAVQPVTVTVTMPSNGGGSPTISLGQGAASAAMKKGIKAVEPIKKPVKKIPVNLRPKIESVLFVQGPVGFAAPGILAPGGRIYLKGRRFGTSVGRLYLKVNPSDFPQYSSGEIELSDLKWKKDKVNGRIPSGMKAPIHRANVEVVLRNSKNHVSNGFPRQFEVPVETKLLTRNDPEVRLIYCDDYATFNRCQASGNATMSGFHSNAWGVIAGFTGHDDYSIHLKNGWVFSRVAQFNKNISGNDGDYVKPLDPPLAVGKAQWSGSVKTKATSDDQVSYGIYIEVKRAKGAW